MIYSYEFRKMDDEVMASLNEAMIPSFKKGFSSGYEQQKGMEDAAYAKYADIAVKALEKSKDFAEVMEKKTGLSPALTISLVAAGVTGGASAIPMGALMYFARKYYTKGLAKAVDIGVDTVADTAQAVMGGKPKPQLQPEWIDLTFKEWLMFVEEKQGWIDWGAEKLGRAAGRVSGAVAGLVGNVASTIASRLKELGSFISKNPRQAAKIALTVGLAVATGGMVGKLSKDLVTAVGDKIHSMMPQVNHEDLVVAQNAVVPGSASVEAGADSMLGAIKQKISSFLSADKPIDTSLIADNPTNAGELRQTIDNLMKNLEMIDAKKEGLKKASDFIKELGWGKYDQAMKSFQNLSGYENPYQYMSALDHMKEAIKTSIGQKYSALQAMESGAKAAY